ASKAPPAAARPAAPPKPAPPPAAPPRATPPPAAPPKSAPPPPAPPLAAPVAKSPPLATPPAPVAKGPPPARDPFLEDLTEVMEAPKSPIFLEPDDVVTATHAPGAVEPFEADVFEAAPSVRSKAAVDSLVAQTATPWRGDDRKSYAPGSDRPDPRDGSRWLSRLLLLIVLAGVVAALGFFWPQITEPFRRASHPDLDYVPPDAVLVASVRVS